MPTLKKKFDAVIDEKFISDPETSEKLRAANKIMEAHAKDAKSFAKDMGYKNFDEYLNARQVVIEERKRKAKRKM